MDYTAMFYILSK